MNSAAVAGSGILQAVNEEAVVVVSGKDDVAVIAAQDHVLWLAGKVVAGKAGHRVDSDSRFVPGQCSQGFCGCRV